MTMEPSAGAPAAAAGAASNKIRPRDESVDPDAAAAAAAASMNGGASSSSKRARTMLTDGDSTVFSFQWPNEPVSKDAGREFYNQIQITTSNKSGGGGATGAAGAPMTVRKGDAVCLTNDEGSETMVLFVDGFFVDQDNYESSNTNTNSENNSSSSSSPVKVQGRWFLGHKDLVAKLGGTGGANAIPPQSQTFLDRLQHNELVLTNLKEEHDIAAIEKKCNVYYFQRTGAPSMDSLAGRHLCRYKLNFDAANRTLEWGDWDAEQRQQQRGAAGDNATVETLSSEDDEDQEEEDDDESSASSEDDENRPSTIQEGEGTTLRGEIQVGPNYQMKVGPFLPGQTVVSRKPKVIYKADQMSDVAMTAFLNQVADLHNAYLQRHGMSMEEPYSPLPYDQVEEIMRQTPGHKPPTGSFMSTASMLGGVRSRLSKECNADTVLEILADHDYDTDRALLTIEANLNRITVGWTRAEKEIFDDGFRRHHGALRMIAKAIGPTKSLQDVIDYYYRYKIPDQFRKYQDKKREQAIKMVECIETRKYHESLSNNVNAENNGNVGSGKHWSEKSVASIAQSKEERIQIAKKLLLDVKDTFGREVMAQVGSVIRQLQVSYEPEARDVLFQLLQDQPEMQKRFLEFLPKHF